MTVLESEATETEAPEAEVTETEAIETEDKPATAVTCSSVWYCHWRCWRWPLAWDT